MSRERAPTRRPVAWPTGEVGSYVLRLYCQRDAPRCQRGWGAEFTGTDLKDARTNATLFGWTRRNSLGWICPTCGDL